MTFRKELVLLALLVGAVLTFAQPRDGDDRRATLDAPLATPISTTR